MRSASDSTRRLVNAWPVAAASWGSLTTTGAFAKPCVVTSRIVRNSLAVALLANVPRKRSSTALVPDMDIASERGNSGRALQCFLRGAGGSPTANTQALAGMSFKVLACAAGKRMPRPARSARHSRIASKWGLAGP